MMIIEVDAMHNHNMPVIALHGALGLFFVFSRGLTHGVMRWSGLRTPGYMETPGNMALLCLCLQALVLKLMRAVNTWCRDVFWSESSRKLGDSR